MQKYYILDLLTKEFIEKNQNHPGKSVSKRKASWLERSNYPELLFFQCGFPPRGWHNPPATSPRSDLRSTGWSRSGPLPVLRGWFPSNSDDPSLQVWGQESVDVVALVTGLPASSSSFLPLVSWYMVSLPVEGFAWFGKGRTTLPSDRKSVV